MKIEKKTTQKIAIESTFTKATYYSDIGDTGAIFIKVNDIFEGVSLSKLTVASLEDLLEVLTELQAKIKEQEKTNE